MFQKLRRYFDVNVKAGVKNLFPYFYDRALPYLESIPLKPFGDIYHADNVYDYDKLRISTNF